MTYRVQHVANNVTYLMNKIMANFKEGSKITVLVRDPGNDQADFCMTSDDLACVEAMVRRRIEEIQAAVPPLTTEEQKAQGARCGCLGTDDYCPCQNVPDAETYRIRAEARAKAESE